MWRTWMLAPEAAGEPAGARPSVCSAVGVSPVADVGANAATTGVMDDAVHDFTTGALQHTATWLDHQYCLALEHGQIPMQPA